MGSQKNKFAILGVEAPAWQGAKTPAYLEYYEFSQRTRTGCIGRQNVTFFE